MNIRSWIVLTPVSLNGSSAHSPVSFMTTIPRQRILSRQS